MMSSQEKWYWRDQGFEDIEVLKVDRTTVFKADFYDTPVVVKHALTEEADKGVMNAASFNTAVRSELKHRSWVVPEVVETGEWNGRPWVAQTWIDGEALGSIEPFSVDPAFATRIDRVVELLHVLDNMRHQGACPFDDVTDTVAYTKKRVEATRAYAEPVVEAGFLSQELLDAAMEQLAALEDHLTFRYQHHDILPWHIIDMGNGNLGLIDAEFGGWRVRFYDLAYMLVKLKTTIKDDRLAADIWSRARETFDAELTEQAFAYPLLFTLVREMSERLRAKDERALEIMRELLHDSLNHRLTF